MPALFPVTADNLTTAERIEVIGHDTSGEAEYVLLIQSPDEIYTTLRRMGTRYVVIEDRPVRSTVLTWLQQELLTSNFAERWRQPIDTRDHRLRGRSLVIYEFLGAGPPDPDADLSMDLPLVGRSLAVRLSDLMERKYLR